MDYDIIQSDDEGDDLETIKQTNLRLRNELDAQVQLFEQYMRVATLQERKQQLDKKKEKRNRGFSARQSLKSSVYNSDEDLVEISNDKNIRASYAREKSDHKRRVRSRQSNKTTHKQNESNSTKLVNFVSNPIRIAL